MMMPFALAQDIMSYLDRPTIQAMMQIQPLRDHFSLDQYYCREHGTKLERFSLTIEETAGGAGRDEEGTRAGATQEEQEGIQNNIDGIVESLRRTTITPQREAAAAAG
jgi:hypothetical protein